jgi:hypothetical protein
LPPFGPVYPVTHAQSVISSLCIGESWFAGQNVQAVWPGTAAYLPVWHGVHGPPAGP